MNLSASAMDTIRKNKKFANTIRQIVLSTMLMAENNKIPIIKVDVIGESDL